MVQMVDGNMPKVLCMDVDPTVQVESEYRLLIGDQIKYLLVDPGILDGDTLSFPPDLFNHLPELPPGDWTRARIFKKSGQLAVDTSNIMLKGVTTCWHQNMVDVRSLIYEKRLGPRVGVVKYNSKSVIAKIARFEYEVPWAETETAIYQAIDGYNIGPAFIGHLVEHNRVMGFLLQSVEGRRAEIGDLGACQAVVEHLHSLGIVHGDLNRHNFIVSPSGVTLIDFENAKANGNKDAMHAELSQLTVQLKEDTGRGGGYIHTAEL